MKTNSTTVMGPIGALALGIGAIVGGGFFATFGVAAVGARGATFISFAVAGALALMTADAYYRLTLRYPGPGGTVSFLRIAFGERRVVTTLSILLILSYCAIMAVYAAAVGSYATSSLPEPLRHIASQVLATVSILLMGVVNYSGTRIMQGFERFADAAKLGILVLFIIAAFAVGHIDWSRFAPVQWAPPSQIVANAMVIFLAYEGFELISNASGSMSSPRLTLRVGLYGSVVLAIVLYVLTIFAAAGHVAPSELAGAQSYALSLAASKFMGPIGAILVSVAAVIASASAINADLFGAAKLPVSMAIHGEAPRSMEDRLGGRPLVSMAAIAGVAILSVNLLSLPALSAATSAGFLLVYASVNVAAYVLAKETGGSKWLPGLTALLSIAALIITVAGAVRDPSLHSSLFAMGAIALLSLAIDLLFRYLDRKESSEPPKII